MLRAFVRHADSRPRFLALVLAAISGATLVPAFANACDLTVHAGDSIQAAVNASFDGDLICIDAGTFTQNVTIDRRITLQGAGSTSTILASAVANTPVITVTGTGLDADRRLVVRDLKLTGATGGANPGAGILVVGTGATAHLSFENLLVTSNQGAGIAFNNTVGVSDVRITSVESSSNGNAGVRIASAVPSFVGLTVSGCTIRNNATHGFDYNPSGVATNVGTDFSFINTQLSDNSRAGIANSHDMSFFNFNGNAALTDVTVVSSNGPGTTHKAYAIVFYGKAPGGVWSPAGNITLTRVSASGVVGKGALTFQRYSGVGTIQMTDVDVTGMVAPWGQVIVDHTDSAYLNIGNAHVKTIVVWDGRGAAGTSGGVDARGATFHDLVTGDPLNKCNALDQVTIASQIGDFHDLATLGEVLWESCRVGIDVRPNNTNNQINTTARQLVPIAILGAAGFDPVVDVDIDSVTVRGASPLGTKTDDEDINGDGLRDLTLYFRARDIGAPSDTECADPDAMLVLEGATTGGFFFSGTDHVTWLGC